MSDGMKKFTIEIRGSSSALLTEERVEMTLDEAVPRAERIAGEISRRLGGSPVTFGVLDHDKGGLLVAGGGRSLAPDDLLVRPLSSVDDSILRSIRCVTYEVEAERRRQVLDEGWTLEHDDEHTGGELAQAAACYASPVRLYLKSESHVITSFLDPWPWESSCDKRLTGGESNVIAHNRDAPPELRRANLIRAAALIVAEVERLDRASRRGAEKPEGSGR